MENNVAELIKKLEVNSNIIITSHAKPDGDAIGSSLALYHFLKKRGHFVRVIVPDQFPGFLSWLRNSDKVLVFDHEPAKCSKLLNEAHYIFSLDYNATHRCGNIGPIIEEAKAEKVMIDHHLKPENFADYKLWNSNASSTCELIYDFIIQAGGKDEISKPIAESIYTGIMTDTGSFRFPSTTAHVHKIIAHLIECGAQVGKIHQSVYDSYTENRLRFIGHVLKEKMTILPELSMAYIAISREEREKYKLVSGDTEGLVNYPLSMKSIKMAVMITDRTSDEDKEPVVRMSFRSQGDLAVNEIASNHFSGGGHKNAAGGTSNLPLEETVEKLLSVLPTYKKMINEA